MYPDSSIFSTLSDGKYDLVGTGADTHGCGEFDFQASTKLSVSYLLAAFTMEWKETSAELSEVDKKSHVLKMLEKSSNWGFVQAIHEGIRDLDIAFPIRSSLSQCGRNSCQLACCALSFFHRRHISAFVPQGKHIPAGTDAGWPARIFECSLRNTYQHQITTCQR